MTSYVMCNKKKLGIRKSDIECLKKSVEDRKLEYFKSELLKILDKKEKEESGEEVSKAFIVQELYKSMTDPLYMAKSREKLVPKQIIATNTKTGKTYKTTVWVNPDKVNGYKKYNKESQGAKIAIGKLKKKIDACTNSQELLNLVLMHKDRFCDELGRPLAIVQELSQYVSKANKRLEKRKTADYKNSTTFDKKTINTWANKTVFNEAYYLSEESVKLKDKARAMKAAAKTKAEKKAANKILEDAKLISKEAIYKEYDNEPKKIGTIANYLMVLFPNAKDNGIYCGKAHFVDHIVNHHPEMPLDEYQNLNSIISSKSDIYEDSMNGSIAFVKTDNGRLTLVALKEDKNGKIVFWKTQYKTGTKLTGKFKKISLGDYSKAKHRIETATSQISQPEQSSDSAIKPVIHGRSDNSNIAQDYTVVNKNDKENPAVQKSFASIVNELKKSYFDNIGA